jgi:putative FmdB family regulatory protein
MTYEYVCEACGNQWEAEQSIKAAPLVKCVSCGEDKAKRLISGGTGFLLKGGGWYADLYGSPGSGAAKAGSEEKGKGATAKSEGSEAKSTTAETAPSGESKSTGAAAATASTPAAPATPAASSTKASSAKAS